MLDKKESMDDFLNAAFGLNFWMKVKIIKRELFIEKYLGVHMFILNDITIQCMRGNKKFHLICYIVCVNLMSHIIIHYFHLKKVNIYFPFTHSGEFKISTVYR